MLHANHRSVRPLLFQGNFGLERETLRIDADGYLAQTPHPFGNHPHIVRDFSENQIEINTGVQQTPQAALAELAHYDKVVHETLAQANPRELLWPFSNPPRVRNEADVPIAQFVGEQKQKTAYREYLAQQYGRYKMTLCGIHVNFSFAHELLQEDFAVYTENECGNTPTSANRFASAGSVTSIARTNSNTAQILPADTSFISYKNKLYLALAERCVAYAWVLCALTTASPLAHASFYEQDAPSRTVFTGVGSVRCSEAGYWNSFTPVLNYQSPEAYAQSIQHYINEGLITCASELYYPVRVKPQGAYNLDSLREGNISHLELRMFDLNPTAPLGIYDHDIFFVQLLMLWLASTQGTPLSSAQQVQAMQNCKNAAHFDLRTVPIRFCDGHVCTADKAVLEVLSAMEQFFHSLEAPHDVFECLHFQREKMRAACTTSYARVVRERFSHNFVEQGIELAQQQQAVALARSYTLGEEPV